MGIEEYDSSDIKRKCRDPDLERIIGRTGIDWLFTVTSAMNGGHNLYMYETYKDSMMGTAFGALAALSFSASALEFTRGSLSKVLPDRPYEILNKASSVVGLLSATGSSLSQFVVPFKYLFFKIFTPLTALYYGWKTYKLFKEY